MNRHPTARLTPYGDSAFLIEVADVGTAHLVARAIAHASRTGRAPDGIEDLVTGFASVVVRIDPDGDRLEQWEQWLADLVSRDGRGASAFGSDAPEGSGGDPEGVARTIDVPTTFDGPDLEVVASGIGCSPAGVVELLTQAELRVAFVGFVPGFPYLTGLPPELVAVARRSTPRPSVPAGSVAVAGGFASIYPRATPGGWMLLGRTALPLFDPDAPPYALVRPGDAVRFSEIADFSRHAPTPPPPARPRPPLAAGGPRFVEVLDPGFLSLVVDGGRRSVAAMGIPRSGPCDRTAMRLANRLVGNADGAAAVECTASGPTLRFEGDGHVAVVASSADAVEVRIDGHSLRTGAVAPVRSGQTVAVGRLGVGLRAYLAVSGGFDTPETVGSRSSDLLSGLGPGPLLAGDRLGLGAPARPHGHLTPAGALSDPGRPATVRVVAGPHAFPPFALKGLVSGPWAVGDATNRIGIRLTSDRRRITPDPRGIPSTGMVAGAIQVPPDGNPIVLMPDHATVGGYPVVACAITADLPILGQLRPGDSVVFTEVDRPTARHAHRRSERGLAGRVAGWYPTAAGT